MKRINWDQIGILSERYLEVFLGDRGNLALLLLQAPIIALCIVLVWKDVDTTTNSLYFVLALSAVWFGAINSCREIVKEQSIFIREARVGLQPTSYLLSKFIVLAMLGFLQCLLLVFAVNVYVPLPGPTLFHFAYMFMASLGGTALGLLLSCLMSSSDKAVGAVPIVLLPQILFSEAIMSHDHSSNLIKTLDSLTLTSWTYSGLKEVIKQDYSFFYLSEYCLALAGLTGVLLLASNLLVWRKSHQPL